MPHGALHGHFPTWRLYRVASILHYQYTRLSESATSLPIYYIASILCGLSATRPAPYTSRILPRSESYTANIPQARYVVHVLLAKAKTFDSSNAPREQDRQSIHCFVPNSGRCTCLTFSSCAPPQMLQLPRSRIYPTSCKGAKSQLTALSESRNTQRARSSTTSTTTWNQVLVSGNRVFYPALVRNCALGTAYTPG